MINPKPCYFEWLYLPSGNPRTEAPEFSSATVHKRDLAHCTFLAAKIRLSRAAWNAWSLKVPFPVQIMFLEKIPSSKWHTPSSLVTYCVTNWALKWSFTKPFIYVANFTKEPAVETVLPVPFPVTSNHFKQRIKKIRFVLFILEGYIMKSRWLSQHNKKDLQGQLCQVV